MKDFVRFVFRLVAYPVVVLFSNLYKLYQSLRWKKKISLKYDDIVDGFSYLIIKNPQVEKVAKARAAICARCPFAEYLTTKPSNIMVNGKNYSVKGMRCSVCGCALAAKVRAMNDSCPRERWEARQDIA